MIPTPMLFSLIMSIVISNQQIQDALPIGLPKEAAEAYLVDLGETFVEYITRETDNITSPAYPWLEPEIGHYRTRIMGVQTRWWWPSFSRSKLVRVGINKDGEVSQVNILTSFSGFP
tara:strand:+ start:24472 stop:24822 length:351 start_codon:yes stop_codon:yes gene_type:complete